MNPGRRGIFSTCSCFSRSSFFVLNSVTNHIYASYSFQSTTQFLHLLRKDGQMWASRSIPAAFDEPTRSWLPLVPGFVISALCIPAPLGHRPTRILGLIPILSIILLIILLRVVLFVIECLRGGFGRLAPHVVLLGGALPRVLTVQLEAGCFNLPVVCMLPLLVDNERLSRSRMSSNTSSHPPQSVERVSSRHSSKIVTLWEPIS